MFFSLKNFMMQILLVINVGSIVNTFIAIFFYALSVKLIYCQGEKEEHIVIDQQIIQKQQAGEFAATLITDGMIVGLGTGSTVRFFIEALAARINNEGLNITGVTTSNKTSSLAKSLGIKLASVDEVPMIDLTIDGADEVDHQLNGIKGGGAALLFEKIVALNSKKNIWIIDESKYHEVIGQFPLPVEVVPYGSHHLLKKFLAADMQPTFRRTATGERVTTDVGNYIIDLHLKRIEYPQSLAYFLEQTIGVVEHGLFLKTVDEVIIGGNQPTLISNTKP
ncbi:ribose 5-phosphate isomerase A [Weissella paramesenteroides]|nr:ribose 5-phosphate isomerase A [Weissella paramesenteroides]